MIIKIDGVEYITATRIPISNIRDIIKYPTLHTDGQEDVFSEVKKYIEQNGIKISDEGIKKLILQVSTN